MNHRGRNHYYYYYHRSKSGGALKVNYDPRLVLLQNGPPPPAMDCIAIVGEYNRIDEQEYHHPHNS